jgi:fatty-acyl-CoA synthase
VVGVPDARWGEAGLACVVLHPGASVAPDALREWLRGHLAGYKVPRTVVMLDALPLSGAGKILKRELRERFRG